MKTKFVFIILFLISIISPLSSEETDCNEFDKLSAKYVECTAKKLKEKASEEIDKGKKKLKNLDLEKKLINLKKVKLYLI